MSPENEIGLSVNDTRRVRARQAIASGQNMPDNAGDG